MSSYPPLSEVRDTVNVQWYRSPMKPERFRELSKRSDAKGWKQAGGHLALFLLTGALTYYFWAHSMWIGFAIALFAHGTVASFFRGTSVHELGHGTVFETKWLNNAFLYAFSLIGWWNPFDYALSHTYHHRYTLHPDGDREVLLPLHPNVGKTFLLQMFTINLSSLPQRTFGKGGFIATVLVTIQEALGRHGDTDVPSNGWKKALHDDQPEEFKISMRWSQITLLFHGIVTFASLASGQWVWFFILVCPSYIANWLSYFLGLTQHCGLRDNVPDFRKSVRSMRLPWVLEFLYWHMNWHTEHHMYAGVPCYNLKALHEEVKDDMPEPRTLVGAWREMLDVWEKQKSDPDYQFDTPLPPTAKTERRRGADAGEASIGELAPKGLA